jgi:hypothetical protein
MRKISAWAAIIAVPTVITGFYGMNVPYPGFGDVSGLVAAAAAGRPGIAALRSVSPARMAVIADCHAVGRSIVTVRCPRRGRWTR